MNKFTIKTHPKINLTLDVLSKRSDGYHEVKMLMQSLELYDEITIELIPSGIELDTNLHYLPNDRKNIAYKACEYFLVYFNIKNYGVKMFIKKNIPVSAGLAGGSSNAAGVLLALNEMLGVNAPIETLMEIGLKLGADVPYCILGKTALAEGLGEKLTVIKPLPETIICLAKPNFSVSTAEVFKSLDVKHIATHPDTNGAIAAIEQGNLNELSKRLFNVLEQVTMKQYPIINNLKHIMLDNGALGSVMSGSGPTVFGIFDDIHKANKACDELKKHVGFACVTKTI